MAKSMGQVFGSAVALRGSIHNLLAFCSPKEVSVYSRRWSSAPGDEARCLVATDVPFCKSQPARCQSPFRFLSTSNRDPNYMDYLCDA